MNLLYSNDTAGHYPQNSWYSATAEFLPEFTPAEGDMKTSVVIVGAGYTGLSAALHLAKAGVECIVLDAQRVGFGASGRNGGQVGAGQRMDQRDLIKLVGAETGDRLWHLAEDAIDTVKTLVKENNIDCYLKPGVANIGLSKSEMHDLHAYADFLVDRYGVDDIEKLDRDASQALCPSPAYYGGILEHNAAHLHPLRYVLGLARAARDAGVKIYEQSCVTKIDKGSPASVHTDKACIKADYVILATNGYMGNLDRKVASRVMPINNFIAATEPLGNEAVKVLTRDIAVADTKFVVNYFRMSHDGRLLFGGGENYSYKFPTDIASKVRKPMSEIFPHLSDVKIDYAWGGTLGITVRRMPYFARIEPNILNASGYSGHGVGTASQAGKLLAQAICGDADGFNTMAAVPSFPFPGGNMARTPLLILAMTWYSLRDKLGF